MGYIPLEAVESSMIAQIGYDHKTQTLRVVFSNGDAYDYPTFSDRDWRALQDADSVGKHFHRAIRPVFGHRRVTEAQLKEPCCDHPDRDTCDERCFPCDPGCCPGPPKEVSMLSLLGDAEILVNQALQTGNLSLMTQVHDKLIALRVHVEVAADALTAGPGPECSMDHACCNRAAATPHPLASLAMEMPGEVEPLPDEKDKPECTCAPDGDGCASCGLSVVDAAANVDETASPPCAHARREVTSDGTYVVCADCGITVAADCPHGADGRDCAKNCPCVPCHKKPAVVGDSEPDYGDGDDKPDPKRQRRSDRGTED